MKLHHFQICIIFLLLGLLIVGCKTAPGPESQTSTIAPHLVKPLEFADFTVSTITSEGASNLMSQKIKAGSDDPDAYNFLTTNWDSARIRVETVNEYEAAIRAGYFPYNNIEIAMESYFKSASSTLTFMQQARPSSHSYLSKHYLTELPVTVLYWTGDEQDKLQKDAGRAAVAAAQKARWAKIKGAKAKAVKPIKKKNKMSAAGRARIAAAQKARWAKIKAEKK